MYDWITSTVIVFLTHPGILIDMEIPENIPGPAGSVFRGMWQATWTLVMQSFSGGSEQVAAFFVYYFIFFIWVAIKVQMALKQAARI